MIPPVFGLGGARVNHNAVFCIFRLNQKISLIPIPTHLTHWGRVTHINVSKLNTIGSDNGLSPGRRQAIILTNAGILLIRTLGTNFSEILGEIHSFSFSKMHLKMSSAKCRLFGLGLNELTIHVTHTIYQPHKKTWLMPQNKIFLTRG